MMNEVSIFEAVTDLVTRGGWVMIPIFFVGWFAWILLVERFCYFGLTRGPSLNKFWKVYKNEGEEKAVAFLRKRHHGFFLQLMNAILKYQEMGPNAVRNGMEAARHEMALEFSKSLKIISVCASIAPMLGLLGTVTGMVHTFETIQQFGFGNPVLLADGISEALLTTQAGLLVAFPLMLAHNYLTSAIGRVEKNGWSAALRFETLIFSREIV